MLTYQHSCDISVGGLGCINVVMSDVRMRSRWQRLTTGFAGLRARDNAATQHQDENFVTENMVPSMDEFTFASLGDLPLSKEAGWRDKIETPEPMELERRPSADENCHHDANIDAPPSQGSKGPKVVVASPAVFVQQEWTAAAISHSVVRQSMQSDNAALSPGTQELLDVLHSSRTTVCLQASGAEIEQVDVDRSPHLQPCNQTPHSRPLEGPLPTARSPPLHSASDQSSAAVAASEQLRSDASLRYQEHTAALQADTSVRAVSQQPSESASCEAGPAEKPVGSGSRAPDSKRSPDLLSEFLQLTLQPPSTAQTNAAASSTPLSGDPELLRCQRLMVSGLPTPPTDSQCTQEPPGTAPSEEASGAAAPSLSSMWQCSSATVWTLSPAAEDSELQQAQYVSPPRDGAVDSNHSSPALPPPALAAGSQQHHVAVEQLDVEPSFAQQGFPERLPDEHEPSQPVAPVGARDHQQVVDVVHNRSAMTPEPASSTCCSGSVQHVPEVSAYAEVPDGTTACSSDTDTRSLSPELSPLLMNIGQRRSSQLSQQSGSELVPRGRSDNEPHADCAGQLDFRDDRHSKAVDSAAAHFAFPESGLQHPCQHPKIDRAGVTESASGGACGVPSDIPTPVGKALSAHSQLLSPPDTGMTGDGDSAQLQPPSGAAVNAGSVRHAIVHEGADGPAIVRQLPDSQGLVHASTGESAEDLKRSWTRLQLHRTGDGGTTTHHEASPREGPQVTARSWLPRRPSPHRGASQPQPPVVPASSSSGEQAATATAWQPPPSSPPGPLQQHASSRLASHRQQESSQLQQPEDVAAVECVQKTPPLPLTRFQRAILSNIPTASATKGRNAPVPAIVESPPLSHRKQVLGSPCVEHEGPRSPDLVGRGPGNELEEAGTPPLSVRASSTLQELLKSNCGRNAQSAIREVLACLAAEERKLEETTAPQSRCSSPCWGSQDGAARLVHAARRAVPFDGDTDTSQSHDTLLEASAEAAAAAGVSFQREASSPGDAARDDRDVVNCRDSDTDSFYSRQVCMQPGMHEQLAGLCDNIEETVRVVASTCEFDLHHGEALPARNAASQVASSDAEQGNAVDGRACGVSGAPQEKHTQPAVQTRFSLVSGREGYEVEGQNSLGHGGRGNVYEARLQECSLRSLVPDRDSQGTKPTQPNMRTKEGHESWENRAAEKPVKASAGHLRANSTRPAAMKAGFRNGSSVKPSKAAPQKVRCQRGRSTSAKRVPARTSTPEHPAWKPPCGPLATGDDTPRTRASPMPSAGRVQPPTEPVATRTVKGKLKAKRTKKVKTKRAASRGTVAMHASEFDGDREREWSWARDGPLLGAATSSGSAPVDTIASHGGDLERCFGTKASRAATLAQIRDVQTATAMAATAHLRNGRQGSGAAAPHRRPSSNLVSAAGRACNGAGACSKGRSNSRHSGPARAPAATSAPHALHATAARLGCDLVRINGMRGSAVQRSNMARAPHRAALHDSGQITSLHQQQAYLHPGAEWPSAAARWSPGECIFRSSKAHGQHAYCRDAAIAQLHHVEDAAQTPRQLHAEPGPCCSADPAASLFSPSGSPGYTAHRTREQDAASGDGAATVGFGVDHARQHRYSAEHTGGTSFPYALDRFGDCEGDRDWDLAGDAGDEAEWLQRYHGDCDPGAQQQRVVQFSAGQPDAHQHRPRGQRQASASGLPGAGSVRRKLTVEELPSYGDKHRRTPREAVPHDGGLLQGFSPWIEVSFFTWRDAILQVPQCPGVYEWGALRHHCNFPEDIIAFYVGKAGTHFAGRGQATLASRFMSYVQLHDSFIGPARAGRESVKTQLFQYFQKHAFRLFYRWRQCVEPEEPADAEEALLATFDYPGNERANRGYRQVMLPDGNALHTLPKGSYL